MTMPSITVVVAGVNVGETLSWWLNAIVPQLRASDSSVEVLLVVGRRDAAVAEHIRRVPVVQVVEAPDAHLVPDLWAAGILRARGRVIAVTITPCRPAPGWLDAIGQASLDTYAGVGGVIDIDPTATIGDRAVHFVRYAPYLPPLAEGPAAEIAADNAVYRRDALEPSLPSIAATGFWEAEVHHALRAQGQQLWLDPRIRVTHAGSYSLSGFSRQRFAHGRRFGRATGKSMSGAARLLRAATAPLVPPLMLARVTVALARRGRLDGPAVAALPLSAWFLMCWAAGEAVGRFDA